jgi:hypothetical protein
MQARRIIVPVRNARNLPERYGEQPGRARYRYGEQPRKRFTPVEVIIEKSRWSLPEKSDIAGRKLK